MATTVYEREISGGDPPSFYVKLSLPIPRQCICSNRYPFNILFITYLKLKILSAFHSRRKTQVPKQELQFGQSISPIVPFHSDAVVQAPELEGLAKMQS